jgi:hypothetical protein
VTFVILQCRDFYSEKLYCDFTSTSQRSGESGPLRISFSKRSSTTAHGNLPNNFPPFDPRILLRPALIFPSSTHPTEVLVVGTESCVIITPTFQIDALYLQALQSSWTRAVPTTVLFQHPPSHPHFSPAAQGVSTRGMPQWLHFEK